jgi:hypothetical protein
MLSGNHFEGYGEHEGHGDHGFFLPALPTLPTIPTTYTGTKAPGDLATATTDLGTAQTALTTAQGDVTTLKALQTTLSTDHAAYEAAVAALLKAPTLPVTTAQGKVAADETAEKAARATDQATIQAVFTKDNPAIITDLMNIAADFKLGAAGAAQLVIDKGKLATDKTTLKTDLAAAQLTIKTAHDALETQEATDETALQTAINTDPSVAVSFSNLSGDQALYQADLLKFSGDRTTYLTALSVVKADIAKVNADIAGNV